MAFEVVEKLLGGESESYLPKFISQLRSSHCVSAPYVTAADIVLSSIELSFLRLEEFICDAFSLLPTLIL